MGLPVTLGGIAGFLIFVVVIIGMTAPDLYPDESQKIKDSQDIFIKNLNSTINQTSTTQNQGFWLSILGIAGLDGIYNFIVNFFSMLISFIIMFVNYFLLFFGIAISLPSEFYILFILVSMSLIVAVIKLIFMAGD